MSGEESKGNVEFCSFRQSNFALLLFSHSCSIIVVSFSFQLAHLFRCCSGFYLPFASAPSGPVWPLPAPSGPFRPRPAPSVPSRAPTQNKRTTSGASSESEVLRGVPRPHVFFKVFFSSKCLGV